MRKWLKEVEADYRTNLNERQLWGVIRSLERPKFGAPLTVKDPDLNLRHALPAALRSYSGRSAL